MSTKKAKKAKKTRKTRRIELVPCVAPGEKKPASCRTVEVEDGVYKVRAAITLAHYLFVYDAKSPDDAERKVREHIMDIEKHHGGYDWYGEASHMHTTFEVEET